MTTSETEILNSSNPKKELEEVLQKKFWELQEKQSSKKPFSQELLTGANYYKGIDSEWNEFVSKIDAIQELTLLVDAEHNKKNGQKINCHAWVFPCAVQIRGAFNEVIFTSSIFKQNVVTTHGFAGKANFHCAEFAGGVGFNGKFLEANFASAKFVNSLVSFVGVRFEAVARFSFCLFKNSRLKFVQSVFLENAWFSLIEISGKTTFEFEECEFQDRFDFSTQDKLEDDSEIINISLERSEFLKTVLFRQEKSKNSRFVEVYDMNFSGVIFREPLVIRFSNLRNSPDLSKAYLLDIKKLSLIEESWEIDGKIDEQKILPTDEPKFRFLKKYFAEQCNHSKEQQYFSYEMEAKRKVLLKETKISYLGSLLKKLKIYPKLVSIFLKKLEFKFASLANWLKNLSEFILFFAYKLTSNFGMSYFRPLACLGFSFYWFGSFFEKIGLENPYAKSFTRTFNLVFPLTSDVERFPLLVVFLTIQFISNAILIYLLILGLRNKFKIK